VSAELPELERLLSDAAERHYARPAGRLRLPWVRAVLPAIGVLAAIGAAVVVLVHPGQVSDERAVVAGPARISDRLGAAFGVFARPERSRSALETELLSRRYLDRALDKRKPRTSWLLYGDSRGGVVAVVGTGRESSQEAVCLFVLHEHSSGGGCTTVTDLLARRDPYIAWGTQQGIGNILYALVRDDVASVEVKTAGGTTQEVPIANNLAYVASPRAICSLHSTNRDGTDSTFIVADPFGSRDDCR
jgi:hypothetical protein